jgi:sigma-B regulation protein RsbU (phosphoserine phosphatase)
MSTSHFIVNSSPQWPHRGPAGNLMPVGPAGRDRPIDRNHETQRRMWPSARPSVPGLDYHAGWRISDSRDVDYLDYFETDGGIFSLAIGDVVAGNASGDPGGDRWQSGSGTLLLPSLHGMVRSLAAGPLGHPSRHPSNGLGDLLQTIHELFYEVAPEGSYATLFLARYDPIERRLEYCNAGHEAPVLLRKSGGRRRTIRLESGGPMVGVLRRSTYRQGSIRLQPGDILAAYTDGLIEARNRRGEEWGCRRLVAAIEAADDRPARDIVEHVLEEAEAFSAGASSGGARRTNDMTLWLGRLEEALSTSVPLETASVETPELAALAA